MDKNIPEFLNCNNKESFRNIYDKYKKKVYCKGLLQLRFIIVVQRPISIMIVKYFNQNIIFFFLLLKKEYSK